MKKISTLVIAMFMLLAMGTAVSAQSGSTTAVYGTPEAIDAVRDSAWDGANSITVDALFPGQLDLEDDASSAQVWTMWDGQYVYFFAEVKDPEVFAEVKDGLYNQDSMGFEINYDYSTIGDAYTEGVSHSSDVAEADRYAGGIDVAPVKDAPETHGPEGGTIFSVQKYYDEVKTYAVQTDYGWAAEVRLPLALYKEFKAGDKIGIEFCLNQSMSGERDSYSSWVEYGYEAWGNPTAFSTLILGEIPAGTASTATATASDGTVVTDGLVAYYDGIGNASDASVWKDSSGKGVDFEIYPDTGNYFTENSLHVENAEFYFEDALVDVVNSEKYTVELALGEIEHTGTDYISYILSPNDDFSIFNRVDGDYIEIKTGGNERPKVAGGTDYFNNSTVAVTFDLAASAISLYIDGTCIDTKPATTTIAADLLFLGHPEGNRCWTGDVHSIRFYDRALTAEEVAANAAADAAKYRGGVLEETTIAEETPVEIAPAAKEGVKSDGTIVTDGLVANYDGRNHASDASVWKDTSGKGIDFEIYPDTGNYFTENSLHVENAEFYFDDALVELVNSEKYTVELTLGEIEHTGTDYISYILSPNDDFSIFNRVDGDYIEIKTGGNERPKVAGGTEYFNNSTVTVTFDLAAAVINLYVDGTCIGTAPATTTIAADLLFLGHPEGNRCWTGDVHSIRFYDRALTAEEVIANAAADDVNYRGVVYTEEAPVVEVEETPAPVETPVEEVAPVETPAATEVAEEVVEAPAEEVAPVEEVVETVETPVATETAPQTFDLGVIAAITALVSAAGYALTKKR